MVYIETNEIYLGNQNQNQQPCNETIVLETIKNYLEGETFSKFITTPINCPSCFDMFFDVLALWENVQRIENICNSREALFLQLFCGNQNLFKAKLYLYTLGIKIKRKLGNINIINVY